MNDFSRNTLPRESPVGREVYMEQRASSNRAAIFAIAGLLVLCVCLCVGVSGVGYWYVSQNGSTTAFQVPSFGATATPTRSPGPTAVPYKKSGKDNAGLRVTVTAYQRPLPAQGITVPDGQELVLVSLRIENTRTTGGPLQYSPSDFKLVSSNKDSFEPDAGTITTGTMLKKGEIAPGKTATGDLVFYVYTDDTDLQLTWTASDGATRLFAVGSK
ncbi:MAG: DUF4352 domain-containing protein [Anaerolineae bacterium]